MNIFDIGVEKVTTRHFDDDHLDTYTAPAHVSNEEIATFIYKRLPIIIRAGMRSGKADTIINNEFGESVRVNFSRIIR